ncbi:hypothetical protein ACWEN3_30175 [Streptomyces sp. NPDC004561]
MQLRHTHRVSAQRTLKPGPATGALRATRRTTRLIASSVLGSDYEVTPTALRSTADRYAASVRLRVYTHKNGGWKESDQVTVGKAD